MSQEKCENYIICNQFINKQINDLYCKDCLFYFNYTMKFKRNILSTGDAKIVLRCPLCLCSPELFVKQMACDHYICSLCIYDIYFDKKYLKHMPKNPIHKLKKSWDLFIYSNQAHKFRIHIIDCFLYHEFNEKTYATNIEKYKFLIPSLFKNKLKSLVQYQLKKNKYICNYKDSQYEKIKTIKTCPYCRVTETPNELAEYIGGEQIF